MSRLGCWECIRVDGEQIFGIDCPIVIVVQGVEGGQDEAVVFRFVHGGRFRGRWRVDERREGGDDGGQEKVFSAASRNIESK